MEDLRVIATRVRLASNRYHEVSDALHAENTQAGSALRALGTPWGDDAEGAAFAQHYLPAADGAQQAVALVADALAGIASILTRSLAATQAGDTANGASFDELAPPTSQAPCGAR